MNENFSHFDGPLNFFTAFQLRDKNLTINLLYLHPLINLFILQAVYGSYKKALSQYPRPGIYPSLHPNSDKPLLHEVRYMGYSLRTSQYRYTEWPMWRPWGPHWGKLVGTELYDHSIDPEEEINLANRSQFQNIRKKLSNLLRKAVKS